MEKIDLFRPHFANVTKLQGYRFDKTIGLDGSIFFDWLCIKAEAFKFRAQFHTSGETIQWETGIKRTRWKNLETYFVNCGIIEVEVKRSSYSPKSTYYFVNFEAIATVSFLKKMYQESYTNYMTGEQITIEKHLLPYFKNMAIRQKEALRKQAQQTKKPKKTDDVKGSFDILNNVLKAAYQRHNDNKQGKQGKTYLPLVVNASNKDRLVSLLQVHDIQTVICSFQAYSDQYLSGKLPDVTDFFGYFLKHEKENESWPVFEQYLNYFRSNYSYSKG